ncbi:hypothetical protein T11_7315 [Trichinella zimbabwensis]|uniref:Uncharacterized protein n=1 Tax=Trichinella zimbabwensis TaxID=268475 RepID=A0A0V1GSI6_9BILA|nr:hypothetical protein T11_7315 [Trichinella zimbabwensis]
MKVLRNKLDIYFLFCSANVVSATVDAKSHKQQYTRYNFTILTTILLCTSRYHWIAQINFKAKARSNYFITVRRASLKCKFSCVALPLVCLTIIARHKPIQQYLVMRNSINSRENFTLLNVMKSRQSKTCLPENVCKFLFDCYAYAYVASD